MRKGALGRCVAVSLLVSRGQHPHGGITSTRLPVTAIPTLGRRIGLKQQRTNPARNWLRMNADNPEPDHRRRGHRRSSPTSVGAEQSHSWAMIACTPAGVRLSENQEGSQISQREPDVVRQSRFSW